MPVPGVPVFDPEGKVRLVPNDQIHNALNSGGELALQMNAPDGKQRYVRRSEAPSALKAGGTFVPYKAQKTEDIVQEQTGIHPFKNPLMQAVAGPARAIAGALTAPIGIAKAAFSSPQTPEEIGAETGGGPLGLALERMIYEPAKAAHKTATEFRSTGHPVLAAESELGALPIIGPMGQAAGRRAASGDILGAITESGTNALLVGAPIGREIVKPLSKSSNPIAKAMTKPLGKSFNPIARAMTEPLGKAFSPIKTAVTEKYPTSLITNLIKPMKSDVKFGKQPAKAILDENIVGNNLPELGDKVYDKLHEVGKQIDQAATDPSIADKTIDMKSSLKPIDEAIAAAVKNGEPKLYTKLVSLKRELTYEWKPFKMKNGQTILRPFKARNLTMSPEQALRFKRAIGDKVRWNANDPFQDNVNQAASSVYGKVKDQINDSVPSLKGLNERYSNLVGAAKAIERRTPVAERNAQWSLSDIALGASGHIPLAIARKVAGMPAIKTRVASGLYGLSHERFPEFTPRAKEQYGEYIFGDRLLPSETIGNAPYGEDYSQGNVPIRPSTITPNVRKLLGLPESTQPSEVQPMVMERAPSHPGVAEDFSRTRVAPSKSQRIRMGGSNLPPTTKGLALPSGERLKLPADVGEKEIDSRFLKSQEYPALNRERAVQSTRNKLKSNPQPEASRGFEFDEHGVPRPIPKRLSAPQAKAKARETVKKLAEERKHSKSKSKEKDK